MTTRVQLCLLGLALAVGLGGFLSTAEAQRSVRFRHPRSKSYRAAHEKAQYKELHAAKCYVYSMKGSLRTFFDNTARRLWATLRQPAFQRMIREKRNWVMPRGTRLWNGCRKSPGACALDYLLGSRRLITTVAFDRRPRYPCRSSYAEGHTNAFAPIRKPILVFSSDYLKARWRGRGQSELVRTLVHETLHTAGFSHRGLRAGSVQYNNTVPAYIGCMMQHWPNVRWIRANCHRAHRSRGH